jgi:hypothetical protein
MESATHLPAAMLGLLTVLEGGSKPLDESLAVLKEVCRAVQASLLLSDTNAGFNQNGCKFELISLMSDKFLQRESPRYLAACLWAKMETFTPHVTSSSRLIWPPYRHEGQLQSSSCTPQPTFLLHCEPQAWCRDNEKGPETVHLWGIQGKEVLRDVLSGATELHQAGCSLSKTFAAMASLLPQLESAISSIDLPSEAQLKQLVSGGHTQELVAGGAAIIDAAAHLHQSASGQVPQPPCSKPSTSSTQRDM